MIFSFQSRIVLLAILLGAVAQTSAVAGTSRQWLAAPVNNNWNNDANWSSGSAPDTTSEGAEFGTSTIHNPVFTADTVFGSTGFLGVTAVTFDAGADAYVIEVNGHTVQMTGGIFNNSSVEQRISNAGANGLLVVDGGSIEGNVTIINSGNKATTNFINGVQGGLVRLINADPTATFNFFLDAGSSTTVGSIEGNGSITLNGTNVSVGSNNLNTVFSGVLSDGSQPNGTLTKIGTGSLTLSGINIYTGDTTVSSGALYVTGAIASARTVVKSGGLLGGTGVIGGSVYNSGIVSPGLSPGKLTIKGNYNQTSGGTLRIEIAGLSPAQHDLLAVGGTAQLGGKLQLMSLNGFKLQRGDSVVFLTAAGVNGQFGTVETDSTLGTIVAPVVVYSGTSVSVEGGQGSFAQFAKLQHLTSNQQAVAGALDKVAFQNRLPKVIDYLDARPLAKLPGDLDKITPSQLTSIFTMGTALASVQSGNIQRRTDDIRAGTFGFNAAGLAINGQTPSYSGSFGFGAGVAGPTGDRSKDAPLTAALPQDSKWGAFLSGTGEWVNVGDTDNARGYNLTSGGFTLGLDYKLTPNLAVGIAAGYTGTSADLADGGRVYVNGGKLGLYATYFQTKEVAPAPTMSKDASKDLSKDAPAPGTLVAEGIYADFAVFGGYNSYDTRRSGLQGEARGDTDGGELNVLFGTGYDFKKGGLTFGPTATFNYTYLGTSAFTEHGSLAPLDVHGGKADSLRTALGFKASYDWKVGGILIRPEIRAAWQHEFGDAAYDLSSNFANGGSSTFLVNGPEIGRDSVLLGAGFALQLTERCSTYFYYDGELARRNYQSNSVTGGLRVEF